jgi:hypothetical protein
MEMRTDKDARLAEALADFKERFKSLPGAAEAGAERSEVFWQRQQAAVRSRIAIEQASKRPWIGFAWASALSLIVLAVLTLRTEPPLPKTAPPVDPDQQLLVSVEQAVHSGVPEALAPAAMLADDISQVLEPVSVTHPSVKEKQSEN